MKDFDDHIADQLDQEGQFPNRSRNWRHLSKRLDAVDLGGLNARPRLRLWQAVAAVAAVSSGLLLWVVFGQKQENAALRKEIAQLRETYLPNPVRQTTPNDTPTALSNEARQVPEALSNEARQVPEALSNGVRQVPGALSNEVRQVPEALSSLVRQVPEALSNEARQVPEALSNEARQAPEAPAVAVVEKPDSLLSPPEAPLLPAPVIDPVKKPLRFKVGPYAVLGFVQPRSKGVTAIKGQGVAAEFQLFRNWWLSASAEWLHYDVCSIEFPKQFYPPKDTIPKPPGPGPGGPGGPHPKLTKVESSQRMQQYGVGLRYEIPLDWWCRPAVRASYNWVRTAPTLITYQFKKEEPHGGGGGFQKPEYAAEKVAAQWQQNQWEIGLGLEKDLPRWTFGLWADFAKSLSPTTPSFDALYVSGGVKYRF